MHEHFGRFHQRDWLSDHEHRHRGVGKYFQRFGSDQQLLNGTATLRRHQNHVTFQTACAFHNLRVRLISFLEYNIALHSSCLDPLLCAFEHFVRVLPQRRHVLFFQPMQSRNRPTAAYQQMMRG